MNENIPNMHNNDGHEEHNLDIPPNEDGTSPPQLNSAIRGHGGAEGGQDMGEGSSDGGGDGGGGAQMNVRRCCIPGCAGLLPVCGGSNRPPAGDEGVEDYTIAVCECGRLMTFKAVWWHIARHSRCDCHAGVIPDEWPFPDEASPMASRPSTPGSMMVEMSSGQRSIESSVYLSTRSPSPTFFTFMNGGHFEGDFQFRPDQVYHFYHAGPMQLLPSPVPTLYYSPELSMSEDDSEDEDEDEEWMVSNQAY